MIHFSEYDLHALLTSLLQAVGEAEYGLRVQGLAAHVLLRMGFRVIEVNRTGHPDLVASTGIGTYRFEVEAEAVVGKHRQLTEADFVALLPRDPRDRGYYALLRLRLGAVPKWLVISADQLQRRAGRSLGVWVLSSLADQDMSARWTTEFMEVMSRLSRERLIRLSFDALRRLALSGRIIG